MVVVVVIVRFMWVIVSIPLPCNDSTKLKLSPAFLIFHLGTASKFGEVQLKLTP